MSPKGDGTDPASGDYTFHFDPTGYPQSVIKKGDVVKYSGAPYLQGNGIFTYDVVMNEKEVYYHFEVLNDSLITRFILSGTGVGHRWNWVERTHEWISFSTVPLDNCDVYNGCGPYGSCSIKNSPQCGCLDKFKPKDPQGWEAGDWKNGCIRSTPLNCEKGDGFVKLPDTQTSRDNKSMSLDECKVECSRNCSCMAFTSLDISRGESGCLLWFGDLVDTREIYLGQEIYIRMAYSESDIQGSVNITVNNRRAKIFHNFFHNLSVAGLRSLPFNKIEIEYRS